MKQEGKQEQNLKETTSNSSTDDITYDKTDRTKPSDSFVPRKSSVFYEAWHEAISRLPKKEQLKAYKYILDYSFYHIEPEDDNSLSYAIFILARPSINSAQNRWDAASENGKKGGRPKKIDENKIFDLKDSGMTNNEIAKKLNISTKSVSRALDKRQNQTQNHNVNVNVNDNVNDNVDVNNVASLNDASLTNGADAPAPSIKQTELSYEDKEIIIDYWKEHMKIADIVKLTSFSYAQVNKTIDEYKDNNYKLIKPVDKKNIIPRPDGSDSGYLKTEFNLEGSSEEELKDLYYILTDPNREHNFDSNFVAKWFKEDYGVDIDV